MLFIIKSCARLEPSVINYELFPLGESGFYEWNE